MAINETSNTPAQAAVVGLNTTTGDGIWGQCDAGRGVVGVSSRGTGLWGHTVAGRGVVGVNNEEGTGVWGETKKGRGIVGIVKTDGDGAWGECDTGRGVVGVSKTGSGVWGNTTNGRSVVGVNNEDGTGVWGETKKGRGVVGISQQDIGVFGKGGQLAGFFEGKVEVTDDLKVHGVSINALVQHIQILEQEIADLKRRNNLTPPPSSSGPQISVTREGSGQNAIFVVSGSGFLPNKVVTIRVVDSQFAQVNFQKNSDANGGVNLRQSIPCLPGQSYFSATDSRSNPNDLTGLLWSNTITTSCP